MRGHWATVKGASYRHGAPASKCAYRDVLKRCDTAKDSSGIVLAPNEGRHAIYGWYCSKGIPVQSIDALVAATGPATGIEVAPNERHGLSW